MSGVSRRAASGSGVGFLFALALAPAAAQAQEPARPIDGILGDGGYQTDLPGRPAPVDIPPEQVDPDQPPARPAQPSATSDPEAGGSSALAGGLLWTLLIAAGVVFVIYLALLVLGRRGTPAAAREAEPDTLRSSASGSGRPGSLADADALAQDENWAEAIHMLLLDGLDKIRHRAGHVVPPALTSRELLRRFALPERQASAFAALVAAVERGHFGGRQAGYDEYQACRAHYRAFIGQADAVPAGEAT